MSSRTFWKVVDRIMVRAFREVAPIVAEIPETCKYCDSKQIVRFGHYHGIQRWWCKDCKPKFVNNDALPGMKTPAIQVASAWGELASAPDCFEVSI